MKLNDCNEYDFISAVVADALAIAHLVRGEDHLQHPEILCQKFDAEVQELQEAKDIWDEIPDVVYYAACLIAWGENYRLSVVEMDILPKYGVSIRDAKLACRAKYARRAAGYKKDIEAERAAIYEALKTGIVPVYDLAVDPR